MFFFQINADTRYSKYLLILMRRMERNTHYQYIKYNLDKPCAVDILCMCIYKYTNIKRRP